MSSHSFLLADFESYITEGDREHVPCGFALQTVIINGERGAMRVHRDAGLGNVGRGFIEMLTEEYERESLPIEITPEDKREAKDCWLCGKMMGKSERSLSCDREVFGDDA